MAIKNLIQLRKGSASEWASTNPVLASGEPGYDITNNIIKIGDGTSSWNSLSALSIDLDTSLVAGTGIALSYNSSNNSLSINLTGNYANLIHSHSVSDITNLQSILDGKQASGSYATTNHTHLSAQITDFNSSVSGLLPGINNSGDDRVLTSTGSNIGINAESNLTFNGSLLTAPSGNFSNSLTVNSLSIDANSLRSKSINYFTARDNNPPASGFATLDTRNSILVLEFDAAIEESAYFIGLIDESRILPSGITINIYWMADTATSGNVRWGVQFEKTGTDLDSDSFDTNSQVTSTANGTSGIESVASINISTIDSLSGGDRYRLRVYRVAADATNDTMSGDAQLVAVEVRVM